MVGVKALEPIEPVPERQERLAADMRVLGDDRVAADHRVIGADSGVGQVAVAEPAEPIEYGGCVIEAEVLGQADVVVRLRVIGHDHIPGQVATGELRLIGSSRAVAEACCPVQVGAVEGTRVAFHDDVVTDGD